MRKPMQNMLLVALIAFLLVPTVVVGANAPTIALPATARMVAEDGQTSWFTFQLFNITSGFDITNGLYPGWCLQRNKKMDRNVDHWVALFSSYDTVHMPEYFQHENWSKINYIINHKNGYSAHSIQDAIWYFYDDYPYPDDLDSQALIDDADDNGSVFSAVAGQKIAILVDVGGENQKAFLELTVPQKSTEKIPDATPVNLPPTASAAAGEPYKGFVGQPITFDGSRSYDRDGFIVSWRWDFGDMTFGEEKIMTHVYTTVGVYNVSLTVTDNEGATNTHRTIATVTVDIQNEPPSAPVVSGTILGTKQTEYRYTAVSTDPDDDMIQYTFHWGDGTNVTITNFTDSGVMVNATHSWSAAGVYQVSVYAQDTHNALSTSTRLSVLIDVSVEYIFGELSGYLIDYENTGIYNMFYNNETGVESVVELQADGTYLIDSDGDGKWDYRYDVTTGVATRLMGDPEDKTPGFELLLLLCAVLLLGLFMRRKNKKKM